MDKVSTPRCDYLINHLDYSGEIVTEKAAPQQPYDSVLTRMKEIHDAKRQDYADATNRFSNFEGAAKFANVSVDDVFAVMVGIKLERLSQLLSGKTPNFESIDDTMLDLANYLVIWQAYRQTHVGGRYVPARSSLNDI